jgi:hypothetical protein
MKKQILTLALLLLAVVAKAQKPDPNHKFAPAELKADVAFIKTQLFDAHADPFTELSRADYESVFEDIDHQIVDSMTATAFYKLVKPSIAPLSDEHAQISIKAELQTDAYFEGKAFLPFTLSKKGDSYLVNYLLIPTPGLQKGTLLPK